MLERNKTKKRFTGAELCDKMGFFKCGLTDNNYYVVINFSNILLYNILHRNSVL